MKKLHQSVLVALLYGSTNFLLAASDVNEQIGLMTENSVKDETDSALVLGKVTVTAKRPAALSTRSVLSSVDFLGADRIEHQNVTNSWELLGLVPSVQITQFKQGTESGKISFRGFNGEGEINAVKLLIDGIPSNTNDGNMRYMDMIFPLELETIEVVKGTNDARYGLHNIAGNVNMVTTQGGNYGKLRTSYGSFQTAEMQAAAGIDDGNFSQNYFMAVQSSSGYRDHADSDKYTVAGKWFFTPDNEKFKVGLTARHYYHDADEPGYQTRAEYHANERDSMPHNRTDGGDRLMNQVAAHLDWFLTERLSMTSKAYYNKFDDTRFVTFSSVQTQQERSTIESHHGLMASLTWRPSIAGLHDVALEGGLNKEWQDNHSHRYSTQSRVRTAVTRDQQFDLETTGAYVQAVIQPIESLKLIPAYRVDRIDGRYRNHLNGLSYDINDYGNIEQPKFSAVYSPLPGYSVYGNWGRTFQVGVGTAAYKVNQSSDLRPSINEGWELGLKFKPVQWLDGRVAVWQQRANNEARRKLGDPANDAENIGKTLREGVDMQLNAVLNERWSAWMAYAIQRSEILKADAANAASVGQEIDHVPRYLWNGGVEYAPHSDWLFSLQSRAAGSYYLERNNTEGKFGQYWVFDASANYRYSQHVSFNVQLRNLTDKTYAYTWWNTTPTPDIAMYGAADGRAIYTSIRFDL